MSRKARNTRELGRHKPKRSPYDKVLIVSEGGKTEPYYFDALKDDLKLNKKNVVIDGNSDTSPEKIVSYAKECYEKDKKLHGKDSCFDRVYCVFDKDDGDHEKKYLDAINAIQTASPKSVFYAITSVPCFEFWILLHFKKTTKPFVRSGNRSPCDNIIHELKVYLPNYGKGDKSIYEQIKGENRPETAMVRAKQVNDHAKASDSDNPSTLVPELIEYLRGLGKLKG